MKGLHHTARNWFLVGMLAATPVLAQDPKGQRQGLDAQQNSTQNDLKADSHHQGSHKRFGINYKSMDANGDGKISKAEFDSAFAKMDTNRDGYLSPEECQMGESEHAEGVIESAPRVNEGTGERENFPKQP
jgi:EF hand